MVYTGHSKITMFTISKTPLNPPPLHASGLETYLRVPKSLKGLHITRVLGPQSPISHHGASKNNKKNTNKLNKKKPLINMISDLRMRQLGMEPEMRQ